MLFSRMGWAFSPTSPEMTRRQKTLVGTRAKTDPLRRRDHVLLCFSFKKAPGRVVYSALGKKFAAVQGSRGEGPRLEFQLYHLVAD